jgi:hypothetical protein
MLLEIGHTGLPDGIFSNQKLPIWVNIGMSCNEKMSVNFTAIRSILMPFRIFYGHLVYFVGTLLYVFPFWYVVPRKIWQPW